MLCAERICAIACVTGVLYYDVGGEFLSFAVGESKVNCGVEILKNSFRGFEVFFGMEMYKAG